MSTLKDPPGSSKAVAQGCICSPTLNKHGQGTLHGRPRFYFHPRCPIHRTEAEQQARERGEVWIIRSRPANGESSGSMMMAAASWRFSLATMRDGKRCGTLCKSTGISEKCS